MATFQYSAVRRTDQTTVKGIINAESERQAREFLREQELFPTSVKPLQAAKPEEKKQKTKEESPLQRYVSEKLSTVGLQEKITFTQNLGMMVKAGIPITEALLYMESYMDNLKFKRLVNAIRLDILGGVSFSRALIKHKALFNDIYISIVQAGEASGELETVLKRLSDMLIAEAKLRKKVISALVYPIMLVVIVTIVLLIMFLFVIPTFADMYNKMGIELPIITKIMVAISDFLRNFWFIALPLAISLFIGFRKFAQSPTGTHLIDKTLLKIPVVHPLVLAVASSHFISTLNISFSAGLPITDCIYMACQTVTNTVLKESFDEVNFKIQAGQRLASALSDVNVLPSMLLIMISTGEESGSLDQMLGHSLEYLEEEVNQRVEVLMNMMEPVMLIVLGVIVGCMALSIYLPLFGMYEHM